MVTHTILMEVMQFVQKIKSKKQLKRERKICLYY